jgi:hypothetical protein
MVLDYKRLREVITVHGGALGSPAAASPERSPLVAESAQRFHQQLAKAQCPVESPDIAVACRGGI